MGEVSARTTTTSAGVPVFVSSAVSFVVFSSLLFVTGNPLEEAVGVSVVFAAIGVLPACLGFAAGRWMLGWRLPKNDS